MHMRQKRFELYEGTHDRVSKELEVQSGPWQADKTNE